MLGKTADDLVLNIYKSLYETLLGKRTMNNVFGAGEKSVNFSKSGGADSGTNYPVIHITRGVCLS